MFAMKQNDEVIRKLIRDGYLSVSKSKVLFTAIGSDHDLEQEKKNLKVMRDNKKNCKFSEGFRQILLNGW